MKILILHGLDSVAQARRTSLHHAFFLPRHAPGHDYWLHAAHSPVSQKLRSEKFDVVIIDTTFLCWRWVKPAATYFEPLKKQYDFLRDSDAIKIAFPQDEYDHAEILDAWLDDWKIDVVYSVCYDDRLTFYPRISQRAEIRPGFTGLYEPADMALVSRFAIPWRERQIDIGYRARRLPPHFGWFGKLKSDIADRVAARAANKGLKLDISCEAQAAFPGDEWLRFLGNCKFILGCESGSSLLDAVGDIKARCESYIQQHPNAEFSEIETRCFAGLDRAQPFKAISPRLFEAAAAGCAQILVPGEYAGALKPWEHYLPLAEDASNMDEIVEAMANQDRMEGMIAASQAALLHDTRLSYATYASDVLSAVHARKANLAAEDPQEVEDAFLRLILQMGERWASAYELALPTGQGGRAFYAFIARAQTVNRRARIALRKAKELVQECIKQRSVGPLLRSALRRMQKLRT